MMGHGMFDGIVRGLIIVGIALGMLICGGIWLGYWLCSHITIGWIP